MGATWEVRLFGDCAAECNGVPARLATYKHWALFANLLIESTPILRATLAERFWRNDRSGRASLSTALLDLRRSFGKEAVQGDPERISLAEPGAYGVDVLDFLRLFRDAIRTDSLPVRLRCLEDATAMAYGPFMPRLDRLGEDEWVVSTRHMLQSCVSEALRMLVDAYGEAGMAREATETARRLAQWLPEAPRSRMIPENAERLAVFPHSFLPGAARRVAGIDNAALLRLEKAGFVMRLGSRWALCPEVRQELTEHLPVEAIRRLEARHARYYRVLAVREVGREIHERSAAVRDKAIEAPNLEAAFDYYLSRRPKLKILKFLEGARSYEVRPLNEKALVWCERVLNEETLPDPFRRYAGASAGELALSLFQYERAIGSLEAALPLQGETPSDDALLYLLMVVNHHAGRPEAAFRYATGQSRSSNARTAREALRFLAEIHRAAGRLDAALECAEIALQSYLGEPSDPLQVAEAIYQLAEARRRNSLHAEAEEAYLASIEIRLIEAESQGVADCLRGLAQVRGSQGKLIESWLILDDAARRYRELGKFPSLAASLEHIAEIHLQRNDRETAYDTLTEARDSWRRAGDAPRAQAIDRRLATLEPWEDEVVRS